MIELSRVPAIRGLTPYDNMLRFLLSTDALGGLSIAVRRPGQVPA
jgi:hypothetical protein